MFVALSSLTYGYAFSVFSTSIGQVGFYEYFDLSTTGPRAGYTNSMLGVINALFSAGAAFGALSIAWLPDWMGRKKTIQLAALISLVGGVRCFPHYPFLDSNLHTSPFRPSLLAVPPFPCWSLCACFKASVSASASRLRPSTCLRSLLRPAAASWPARMLSVL